MPTPTDEEFLRYLVVNIERLEQPDIQLLYDLPAVTQNRLQEALTRYRNALVVAKN